MGAIWTGESQVLVTQVKVEKEMTLHVGRLVPVVPRTSCFVESSVTQEGLRWSHRADKLRVGPQLPSYTSGTEYVKL